MVPYGRQHIFRADDVCLVKRLEGPPRFDLCRHVKDDVAAVDSPRDGVGFGDVAPDLLDTKFIQFRVDSALKGVNGPATVHQSTHDGSSEEPSPAGNQCFHEATRGAAHAANAPRSILALWRMSTGKAWWKSTVRIDFVCSNLAPRSNSSLRIPS